MKSSDLAFRYSTPSQRTLSGGGISTFTDLRHVVYDKNSRQLAVLALGRIGLLDGKWEVDDDVTSTVTDANMMVSEVAFGLEWTTDLDWSVLVLRGQYERQLWNSDVTDDVAFSGGAFRVGFNW